MYGEDRYVVSERPLHGAVVGTSEHNARCYECVAAYYNRTRHLVPEEVRGRMHRALVIAGAFRVNPQYDAERYVDVHNAVLTELAVAFREYVDAVRSVTSDTRPMDDWVFWESVDAGLVPELFYGVYRRGCEFEGSRAGYVVGKDVVSVFASRSPYDNGRLMLF